MLIEPASKDKSDANSSINLSCAGLRGWIAENAHASPDISNETVIFRF